MNVVDDIEWELELEKFVLLKKKHTRDAEAWTENSSRVYNMRSCGVTQARQPDRVHTIVLPSSS